MIVSLSTIFFLLQFLKYGGGMNSNKCFDSESLGEKCSGCEEKKLDKRHSWSQIQCQEIEIPN